MTPSQLDLARRLAAHPTFPWRSWMAAIDKNGFRWRITPSDPDCGLRAVGEGHRGYIASWGSMAEYFGAVPDIQDDATKGVLLGMVRNAYRDPGMFARPRGSNPRPDWAVFFGATSDIVCAAPTEGEALALALLEVL